MTELTINKNNIYASQDYATIINSFEKSAADYENEDYALASHYKDVYSTRNFSERAQEQFASYPGMHQSSADTAGDPFYTNAKSDSNQDMNFWNSAFDSPDSFMDALRDKSKGFDYESIFGSDGSAEERAKAVGKMVTECIPCFGRITDLNQLLPEGNLLEVHALNIRARLDLLDQIKDLFSNPGAYIDICELLNLLSGLCPSDLVAMLAMLTQYLAKLNLDVKFNIDFIVNLVGPILSPFLNALSQWLDKWMQLIMEPMLCVVDHINKTIITAQQIQIPFSSAKIDFDLDTGNGNGLGGTLFADQNAQGGGVSYSPQEGQNNFTAYQQNPPDAPSEEISQSFDEMKQGWRPTETEAERRAKFEKIKADNEEEKANNAPKRQIIQPKQNGARWSSDDVPSSEKYDKKSFFGDAYYPPEKQPSVGKAESYLNIDPIADSLVQMRNILQASIQYSNDWFNYITQMVYDLLSIDIGWMQNKTGNSFIKSRVLQIIILIKSIIEASAKNGLNCGTSNNFDIEQMKYIFENSINKYTSTKFKVNDNGTIEILNPGTTDIVKVDDQSVPSIESTDQEATSINTGIGPVRVPTSSQVEQKAQKSGIIVKNCLKGLSKDQLADVQSWITDYERSINA